MEIEIIVLLLRTKRNFYTWNLALLTFPSQLFLAFKIWEKIQQQNYETARE